ncbi:hypothetical protein [Bacillus sp. UNC322MFChir4.1]|nr:hypothetical protein [Bacillus sp. UNC322MFChir4.1]
MFYTGWKNSILEKTNTYFPFRNMITKAKPIVKKKVNRMNYNEQRQMPNPYGMGGFPPAQVGHYPHGGYPYGYHHVGYHPYHPHHHHYHGYQHVIYHPHHHHHGHHYGTPYQGQ